MWLELSEQRGEEQVCKQKGDTGPDLRGFLATVMISALLLERQGALRPALGLTGPLRLGSFRCREEAVGARAEGGLEGGDSAGDENWLDFGMYSEDRDKRLC